MSRKQSSTLRWGFFLLLYWSLLAVVSVLRLTVDLSPGYVLLSLVLGVPVFVLVAHGTLQPFEKVKLKPLTPREIAEAAKRLAPQPDGTNLEVATVVPHAGERRIRKLP